MADPISGPLTRDELRELAAAPFGEAARIIRRFDPLWGRQTEGELIRWRVRFIREVTEEGYAYVEAATKDDAERLADEIPVSQIDWDHTRHYERDAMIDDIAPARENEGRYVSTGGVF
jgi:acyl-CoA reductase-like NAD-dependent aldehyde dehydrogenase